MSEPNSAFEKLLHELEVSAIECDKLQLMPNVNRYEAAYKAVLDAYAGVVAERDEMNDSAVGVVQKLESGLAAARAELDLAEQGYNLSTAELQGELSKAWEQLAASQAEAALRDAYAGVVARLDEYAGWAPDQFLRYQEEHRKLQQSYIKLESDLAAAKGEAAQLRAALVNAVQKPEESK